MEKHIHPIRQVIRCVHRYLLDIRERNRLKRLVLKEKCLEPGVYKMIHSRRYYLVKANISDNILYSLGIVTNQPEQKNIVIRESNKDTKGQAMMVTAYGFKVFDERNGVVYKKLVSEQEVCLLKKAIELLSPCFRTTYIGIKDGFSEEILIYGKPRNKWQQAEVLSVYISILDNYNKYYKSGIETLSAPYGLSDILRLLNPKCEMFKIYQDLLSESEGLYFPYIYTHGDMHLGNVIYDGQIWYIDFECAREEFFFYDIFNVLYVEFVDCHDSMLLDLFIEGNSQIIERFKRAFASFDLYFDMNKRKLYFKTYLLARIRYDVQDLIKKIKGRDFDKRVAKIAAKCKSVLDYVDSF